MVLRGLIVGLLALLVPTDLPAGEARPSSILVLDQTDMRGPFYHQIFSALLAEVGSHPRSHITI